MSREEPGRGATPRPAGQEAPRLSVLVEGGGDEPERLIVMAPPSGGRVRVQEWAGTWSQPPVERDYAPDDLYAVFARAADARRRVSEELYRIRAWLDGRTA